MIQSRGQSGCHMRETSLASLCSNVEDGKDVV